MTDQPALRLGIVGCGYQGGALAAAAARVEGLRLVACADIDRAAAGRLAAAHRDVSIHASVDALLGDSEVDALLVATPHHVLATITLAGIRAGKHVMVEKPIGLNAQEATEIEAAAAQVGVCCMSGYSFRYGMASHVRRLVDSGAVGEIQAMAGSIGMPALNDGWVAYPESGGGPLLYVGSHLVDFILWFLDEPVQVSADVRYRADTGADETSAFRIRFESGAVAQGLVTQAAPSFFYSFEIVGRQGRLVLRGANFLQYELDVTSEALPDYAQPTVIRPRIWQDNVQMMFVPELADFAAAIRERRPAPITAHDGWRVLKILDAVVQSGQAGVPVVLAPQAASPVLP
jgi:predicted dehydrogenase